MNVDKLVGVHTDLDLNTSGALPQREADVGLDVDSLSPVTRKALTTGFEAVPDPDGNFNTPPRSGLDAYVGIDAQVADGGFLGRPTGHER